MDPFREKSLKLKWEYFGGKYSESCFLSAVTVTLIVVCAPQKKDLTDWHHLQKTRRYIATGFN